MRVDPSAASSLEEVLRSYVEDFSDRFGVRAEFEAEGTLQRLPPRTEAEVLRIVQEALNNVRRHADATVVRVRTERTDRSRGSPSPTMGAGSTRRPCRRRATACAGCANVRSWWARSLDIWSRPQDGTRITVEVTTEEAVRA